LTLVDTPVGIVVVVGSILSGVGASALAVYLRRHQGRAGAEWFVAALSTQALWCLAYVVSFFVTAVGTHRLLEALSWIGMFWTGPLFLAFALEYTGRGTMMRNWRLGPVFAVPTLTTALVATAPLHDVIWSDFGVGSTLGLAVARYTIQPWGFFAVVFGTTCAGVGVLLLIDTVLNYGPLYRREAAAVALSVAAPSVGLLLWLFRVGPVPYLNLAVPLFAIHVALDGYAFTRSNMFETNPQTRRAAERSVIDDIESPVFVLDRDARIVELNDDAASTLDLDPTAVLGTPLAEYLDVTVDPTRDRQAVVTRADGREREFTVTVSSLTDPAGTAVGSTVVMQDVTERRQREQRLSVLNRVIRHNIRNDMNAIMGRAELIAAEGETASVVDSAEIVQELAAKLHDISEQAHGFEQISGSDSQPRRVDLGEVVSTVVTDLRDRFPAATIEAAAVPDGTIETRPDVLRLALSNLASYLLEQNESANPRVSLRTDVSDRTVVVTVADNGPQIERSEVAPIELGQETDLQHASGIELWIISWSVTNLGGEIEFGHRDGGNAVSIRLPRDD